MNFTPPPVHLLLPKIDRVTELTLIDRGGFKAVYRATIGTKVEALKLIHLPDGEKSGEAELFKKEMSGRIRRELQALQKCESQHIVKLGSIPATDLQIEGQQFVVYSEEFLDGPNLWTMIQSGAEKPTERELRTLFLILLVAVQEMWGHGYIHRDIKPSNIVKLQDPRRPFVLLDFGIAYCVQETALTFNPSQRILATYRYLAPEMMDFDFRSNLDYRTDLYTTALTVFEYAAQKHPLEWDSTNPLGTISRALHQAPTPLVKFRPDLSAEFSTLIAQLLKKKPALRPANLNALIRTVSNTL